MSFLHNVLFNLFTCRCGDFHYQIYLLKQKAKTAFWINFRGLLWNYFNITRRKFVWRCGSWTKDLLFAKCFRLHFKIYHCSNHHVEHRVRLLIYHVNKNASFIWSFDAKIKLISIESVGNFYLYASTHMYLNGHISLKLEI